MAVDSERPCCCSCDCGCKCHGAGGGKTGSTVRVLVSVNNSIDLFVYLIAEPTAHRSLHRFSLFHNREF